LNEERNVARAIESLRCADEIVVVDSGSTDRTVEIAQNLGARVVESGWPGFANQKNYAAAQAANDWILSLDADESLSEALEAEIWRLKKTGPQFDAYTMPRMARYLGRWIRHSGWYPDRKTRLYRRGSGRFEGAAHDSFRTSAKVGRLRGDLLHHAFATREEHEATVEAYSAAAALELFAQGKRRTSGAPSIAPAWTFFRRIILQAGFLDGRRGWQIARMSARYTRLKYAKLAQLSRGESLANSSAERDDPARSPTP